MADGIGLSVGAAKLTAVHVGRSAATRTAVLTRYPNRPAEVGVPSENPNLAERGLIITDFVDRVGDPVAIIAADGSSHLAEEVLADALRALFLTLAGTGPSAEPVGVAYPAHWRPAAIDALRRALAEVPEFWSPTPALLVSDATAALTALQQDPGVPARGVIALCDFGATGTSVTLADAARGFQSVGPTVRYVDLSGDLIDQALLTSIVSDLSAAGSVDLSSTSAIGSLTRLRAQCRSAKERLSTAAVTSLNADLPGSDGELRVTRAELDEAIRAPLAGFVAELQETLQQSGIRPSDLVAVATVGGGARIPIITTTLSEHLRVPVITAGQPELAAAIGSGLKAVRGTVEEGATSMAPVAAVVGAASALAPDPAEAPMSSTFRALAWSDADDVPEVAPADDYDYDDFAADAAAVSSDEGGSARPQMDFERPEYEDEATPEQPWYRKPPVIVGAAMLAVLAAVGWALVVVLRNDTSTEPTGNTMSVTATPTTTAASPPPQTELPPPPPGPEPQTVTEGVPPPVVTVTEQPPAGEPAPPPAAPPAEPPPPPPSSEQAPPPASEPPAAQPPASQPPASNPPSTTMFTIPGPIPIPIPIQVPGPG